MERVNLRIFVGGLTMSTTNEDLYSHFRTFGEIFKAEIIYNRKTKKTKGFAFITCGNMQTYEKILLSEHLINGKLVDCNSAFKKVEGKEAHISKEGRTIFVGGLSRDITEQDLLDYFCTVGKIQHAYVIGNDITRHCKGFGYVVFEDSSSLENAVSLHDPRIKGTRINIRQYTSREKRNIQDDADVKNRSKRNNQNLDQSDSNYNGEQPDVQKQLSKLQELMQQALYFSQNQGIERRELSGYDNGYGTLVPGSSPLGLNKSISINLPFIKGGNASNIPESYKMGGGLYSRAHDITMHSSKSESDNDHAQDCYSLDDSLESLDDYDCKIVDLPYISELFQHWDSKKTELKSSLIVRNQEYCGSISEYRVNRQAQGMTLSELEIIYLRLARAHYKRGTSVLRLGNYHSPTQALLQSEFLR